MPLFVRRILTCALVTAAACGSGGGFPDAPTKDAPPPKGTMTLAWRVESSTGETIPCAQVQGQSVVATIENTDAVGGTTELFSCVDGMGTSGPLAPGNYRMRMALNGSGTQLAEAPTVGNIKIVSDQDTAVPAQVFTVNDRGTLKFTIASKPGGNCAAIAANGAGIEGMTLELRREAGQVCVPTTFMIAAGANLPASTYASTCVGAPTTLPCIDADQVISIIDGVSGPYRVVVGGVIATNSCWSAEQQTVIPVNQQTRTETVNLGATGNPGCP
ncbi:MAG TPA: hypothetical protein PLF40_29245 [Kofleriaceae bacterium]|nr:hypothetical protein [Kofleriaceae bacterium]